MDDSPQRNIGLTRGTPVLIVLQSPREKCWGVLDEITSAGVFLRGLDLNAFEDWVRAIVHNEPFIGFGSLFFPMWRVERIAGDEPAGGLPSLAQQLEHRSGRTLEDVMRETITH